jgi:hypothetical protein
MQQDLVHGPKGAIARPLAPLSMAPSLGEFNSRGAAAGSWWTVQFLIRRCAWHMLDHGCEMEDRDLSGGS